MNKWRELATAVAAIGMVSWMVLPRRTSATLIQTMAEAQSQMYKAALGQVPITKITDTFGNVHEPDDTGYCSCWNCPKWDGIEWWQPKNMGDIR